MIKIGAYKLNINAELPEKMTEESACYDVFACLLDVGYVYGYSGFNDGVECKVENNKISILPNERLLVPTGLKFITPKGYSLRLHPRSGLSYKKDLNLANCEGVIDSDYRNETYILLKNNSNNTIIIGHGDRIAQIEVVKVLGFDFYELDEDLGQKTDRSGGLGSTGD